MVNRKEPELQFVISAPAPVPEFKDPRFRENKPKMLVFSHWKRAFWACFRENCVYNFGHGRQFNFGSSALGSATLLPKAEKQTDLPVDLSLEFGKQFNQLLLHFGPISQHAICSWTVLWVRKPGFKSRGVSLFNNKKDQKWDNKKWDNNKEPSKIE